MKGHKLHVRRKLKEIKENEEIIDIHSKNSSEQQLVAFCQFSFGISLKEEKSTKKRRRSSKQRKDKESKGNQVKTSKSWIK